MKPPTGIAVAPADGLCLDFINTRYWRGSPKPTEDLPDIQAVFAWAGRHGGIDAGLVQSTRDWIEADPKRATAAHAAVIDLRETLFALFAGAAAADGAVLARLNAALAEA